MTVVHREVSMTASLKEQLKDQAWSERTTMSKIVREELEEYAAGELEEAGETELLTATVQVNIEDEVYAKAKARAQAAGTPLSEVIRRRIGARLSGGYNPADDI